MIPRASPTHAATPSFALDQADTEALLARFLRYVRIDTRSDDTSDTSPSTPGQWDLLRLLSGELDAMGLDDVQLDEQHGYVYATLAANLPSAPTVGFVAHVDTYHATPGANVKPQVLRDWDGNDITLPGDPTQVVRVAETPQLASCVGHTLVTSDGTTLLGADDKAGIAIIVTMLEWYTRHPEVPHGRVRVAFTPDEEIGRGAQHFDVAGFGAVAAYTIDGSVLGELENETFSADAGTVTFIGADIHPGIAKDRMKSAVRAAAHLIGLLPTDHLPETTEGRESFLHPFDLHAEVGRATLKLLVRAFTEAGLREREADLERAVRQTRETFLGVDVQLDLKPSYRNMRQVLDAHPRVVDLARDAIRMAGLAPVEHAIRGGTDGSQLSYMGLPTPNLFDGALNYHGVKEVVSVQWMAKSCEVVRALAWLWGQEREA